MLKLKIDNIICEVDEGQTIMDAAKKAGIPIPSLCHKDGLPHYSSCMVCMIKDKKSGSFLPSCSALVQPDSDIDASGPDVIALRKKAVELLLSEHRAECEAPCRIVCPAGYNIPLMNRLISSGDFMSAVKLSFSESGIKNSACVNCPGYCENACRRKKIDMPVSIRNLQLYISQKRSDNTDTGGAGNRSSDVNIGVPGKNEIRKKVRRYTSLIGRLEPDELKEWLKECSAGLQRFRETSGDEPAANEAKSCMHCDCRASEDCRLRDLADELSIKDPRGKLVNSPAVKKINTQTNLIFENAKCIKCGLCVRICEDDTENPHLCFINRGFVTIISEPITGDFNDILKTKTKECIEICPTGALEYFR
jgi:ferredoxin